MANEEVKLWGVHTQDDNLFLNENKIALGWNQLGDLSTVAATRDAFKQHYAKVYPEATKQSVANCSGILYRFIYEAKIGDYVIFPSKSDRMINIGQITGEYKYEPNTYNYMQQRSVKWLKSLPRTAFSQGALYEVGSFISFFSVKTYANEFLSALNKNFKKSANEDEEDTVAVTADEIIETTKDFILKELSKQLKGYDLELFIADLLRAMGYRADVSPRGGDRGIDITAYKDELPPRILVQVKSQDGDIKETAIQSLKGAMREGDYGLFVTLSNYTKNARQYLNNTPIIRGINGSDLVDLVLKYYDLLNDKYKKIIPLKMIYIPVAIDDEQN